MFIKGKLGAEPSEIMSGVIIESWRIREMSLKHYEANGIGDEEEDDDDEPEDDDNDDESEEHL